MVEQRQEAAARWLAAPSCAAGCLRTLFADWQEGGAAAIKMMRIERPAEYVRVMCSILPKEMMFETGSVSELDDDELGSNDYDAARTSLGREAGAGA